MINAVVFVRPENYSVNAVRCLEYCDVRHYHVVGLVQGDRRAAMQMLDDGLASVIVVSSADQLDPAREPRIEVVPRRMARRTTNSSRRWTPGMPARARTMQ
ncbi:MAG: hypothetical protein ABW022_14465 [Actinoplanes sp.]